MIRFSNHHKLDENCGVLVVKEGKSECFLVQYNGNIYGPIDKVFQLDSPLRQILYRTPHHRSYFKTNNPIDIEPETNITDLVNKLLNRIVKEPFVPETFDSDSFIQVFKNNLNLIEQGWYSSPIGKVELNVNDIAKDTIVYQTEIRNHSTNHFDTQIEVRQIDCLDMAKELTQQDGSGKVAVLNMANSRDPELRVIHGAKEQEAYLMRCTDYYNALVKHKDAYPIYGEFSGIYTPGVTVFRQSDYKMVHEPWKVNIIAVSGLSRPDSDDETEFASYRMKFQNKIRTIFRIAIDNDQTKLVLGAMGCGGLNNIPKTIAKIFHSVLLEDEFRSSFEHIVFAMLPVDGEDETFNAFYAEFNSEGKIGNDLTAQTFQEEFKSYRFEGELTPSQIEKAIKLIDKKQLNEDSAAREIGENLYFTLFKFAQWLRIQNSDMKVDLDYLIEYDEDYVTIDDIIEQFTSELLDSQGKSDEQIYDELCDDYEDNNERELLIAIGYVKAVQQMNAQKR